MIQQGDFVLLSPAQRQAAARNTSMWNEDLRPCTVSEHSWPAIKFAALWIGMSLCLPTYSLASSMIAMGMNWWEAVLTVFVGSVIVMMAILLVSHSGTKYGIPYPVFARLWFGTRGAHIPALARGLIGAGWFGINSWFGGQAIDAILVHVLPFWHTIAAHQAIAFVLFWALNIAIAMRGAQSIGRLAEIAAPTVALGAIILLIWAAHSAGGFGPMLAAPTRLHGAAFWTAFFPSVVSVIAFWATMALNIPDYTRYATSQRAQMTGQMFAMPLTMALYSFCGIAVTSATVLLFHKALWNPVDLIVRFPTAGVIAGGFVVVLTSVTVNIGANVMAPARAFENLWPSRITFSLGAILTGLLSLAMQPWYEVSTYHAYIFAWLGTYGAMLGSFDGIAIADYWLVRGTRIDLAALYKPDGIYAYAGGFNIHAIVALLIGWLVALAGLAVPQLHFLWSGGWIFSLLGAMLAYCALMRGARARSLSTETIENATA